MNDAEGGDYQVSVRGSEQTWAYTYHGVMIGWVLRTLRVGGASAAAAAVEQFYHGRLRASTGAGSPSRGREATVAGERGTFTEVLDEHHEEEGRGRAKASGRAQEMVVVADNLERAGG